MREKERFGGLSKSFVLLLVTLISEIMKIYFKVWQYLFKQCGTHLIHLMTILYQNLSLSLHLSHHQPFYFEWTANTHQKQDDVTSLQVQCKPQFLVFWVLFAFFSYIQFSSYSWLIMINSIVTFAKSIKSFKEKNELKRCSY